MSLRSSSISWAAPLDRANRVTYPPMHSIIGWQQSGWDYVPLSQRTSDHLLANAAELRRMAQTATTVQSVFSLAARRTLLVSGPVTGLRR
jgi:hypothetical protein